MDSASKNREFCPVMSGLVAFVGVIRSLFSSTESDDISGDPWSLLFPVAGQLLRDVLYLFIYLFIYRTYLPWVTNYNKYSSLVPRYNKINIKLK